MGNRSKSLKLKTKMDAKHKSYQQGSKSGASTNPDRKLPQKQLNAPHSHFRTKQQIQRLRMYNEKPDKQISWGSFQFFQEKPARIDPNRKWFGNIRTIDQQQLDKFRQEMATRSNDPRTVLIKAKKLPISLLVEQSKRKTEIDLLQLETYEDTFGPKKKRKRAKLQFESIDELAAKAEEKIATFVPQVQKVQEKKEAPDLRLKAGQSKRIWEELYKVVDASDILCVILDARDPQGTRVYHIEDHIKKHCPHKHLVLILNKCDLIPTWLTSRWVSYLSKEHPTLAFKANIQKPFGRGPLINLLRQFDKFHRDKQTISVGLVGYPNVGKSSVINAVKNSKVCKAAPIPGETRVWQYVSLTKRIYMIDCPGVVYFQEGKNEVDIVLKGCVRAEKLEDPTYYIPELLKKAKKEDLMKIYGISDWGDGDEEVFLKLIAIKKGRLLKVLRNLGRQIKYYFT